jgi:Xaa-Pro dipeptidase
MQFPSDWHTELQKRRVKIWKVIQEAGCDIGLVYSSREHPEPFRYLTNFSPALGDMWGILYGPGEAGEMTCLLNFHWELNEARQVSGLNDWHGHFDPYPFLFDKLSGLKPRRIAVLGMSHIPWQVHAWLTATLGAELAAIDAPFNLLRRVKSPLEVEMLRESIRVTDLAIDESRPLIRPGATEMEISAAILYTFNKNQCESAFYPLVLGGVDADTAVIARKPRPRPLEDGDTVMIDIGAAYQGYQSDVARTFVIGKPSPLQQHAWDTVRRMHAAVIELCKPGVPCIQLHHTSQAIAESAGYSIAHRIGHGFGLATSFEWPALDTETAELQPGNTLAIEPALYKIGAGAMKLEDNVLITETGCEILSNCSREL